MRGLGWGIGVGAVGGMYLLVSREHRLLREVRPVLQLVHRQNVLFLHLSLFHLPDRRLPGCGEEGRGTSQGFREQGCQGDKVQGTETRLETPVLRCM